MSVLAVFEIEIDKCITLTAVFFGGSFDFDLTPFAALVNPIISIIRNSQMATEIQKPLRPVSVEGEMSTNRPYDDRNEEAGPSEDYKASESSQVSRRVYRPKRPTSRFPFFHRPSPFSMTYWRITKWGMFYKN